MQQSMLRIVLVMMITTASFIALMAQDNDGDGAPAEVDATQVSIEFTDDHTEDVPYWIVLASVAGAAVIIGASRAIFRDRYSWLQYGTVGTIAVTGIIHLIFGVLGNDLLALNGVGYLILAGIRLAPPLSSKRPYKMVLNIVTILYTATTITGYFATHTTVDPIGGFTKVVEFLLIILLILDMVRKPYTRLAVEQY